MLKTDVIAIPSTGIIQVKLCQNINFVSKSSHPEPPFLKKIGGENMSKIKLSLKIGDIGYLEYSEEDQEVLNEKLESILELRNAIVTKLGLDRKNIQTTVRERIDYPIVEHPSSQCDAITKAVYSKWGRIMPRTLNEIHAALAMNAIHIDKKTLGSRLALLTRQGKLRRIKRNGVYAYTVPLGQKIVED